MNSRSCLKSILKLHKVKRPEVHRPQNSNRIPKSMSQELIDQTHRLMEKTILFVSNPAFKRANFDQQIQRMRPAALDRPSDVDDRRPGVAFVAGLPQAHLLSIDEERYLFLWMNFLKFRAERNRRKLDLRQLSQPLVQQIVTDLDQATQARNRIVMGNVRLIIATAKKLAGSIDQMSELIGEGMPPLIRSAELFDVGLGNRFSTYATWAVRNQMIRRLKRNRNQRELAPTESSPSLENFPDQRPFAEVTETSLRLRLSVVNRLMRSLSEKEQAIVAARFGLQGQPAGQSLADISRQVGLSKERVRQIVLQSLLKFRELISYDEFETLCETLVIR